MALFISSCSCDDVRETATIYDQILAGLCYETTEAVFITLSDNVLNLIFAKDALPLAAKFA